MTIAEAIKQENARRWKAWQKMFFSAMREGHTEPWIPADRIRPQRQAKSRDVAGAKWATSWMVGWG